MIMKMIKWFKSLFKCNKVKENSTVTAECQKMMAEYPVTKEEVKECINHVADKPVKKSKKRGRPRKKKKEE